MAGQPSREEDLLRYERDRWQKHAVEQEAIWKQEAAAQAAQLSRLQEQLSQRAPSRLASQVAPSPSPGAAFEAPGAPHGLPTDAETSEGDKEGDDEGHEGGDEEHHIQAAIDTQLRDILDGVKENIDNEIVPKCNEVIRTNQEQTIDIGGKAIKVSIELAKMIAGSPYVMMGATLGLIAGDFYMRGERAVVSTFWNVISLGYYGGAPVPIWKELIGRAAAAFNGGLLGGKVSAIVTYYKSICNDLGLEVTGALHSPTGKALQQLATVSSNINRHLAGEAEAPSEAELTDAQEIMEHRAVRDRPTSSAARRSSSSSARPHALQDLRPMPRPGSQQPGRRPNPNMQQFDRDVRVRNREQAKRIDLAAHRERELRARAYWQQELGELPPPTAPRKRVSHRMSELSREMTGTGRIGIPEPILPYNDISNDHFLNKYPG